MRQRVLIKEMDALELIENMAFDMLQDKDFKQRMDKEISLAEQENQSAQEEGCRLAKMFRAIATVKKKGK